jgi:GT2 family glycosyltransferase
MSATLAINIAILLTCHNRKEKTICCLRSLFACTVPENCDFSVYLVDDGSTDGTSESIRNNFPKVKIIQGNGNLFWNRGMNLAWNTAAKERNYDFYLWLNDDTNLYSNALMELIQVAQTKSNESIVCGSTCAINNKEHITYSGGKFVNGIVHLTPNGKIQECECFNGNIVLIPKHVFEKIGFNDFFYNHSFGDLDYGLTAKNKGIKSFVSPSILGECDEHLEKNPIWNNPKYTMKKRWQSLHSPLGLNPKELFHFNKKHFGIIFAIRRHISIYVRILFPKLWQMLKKSI